MAGILVFVVACFAFNTGNHSVCSLRHFGLIVAHETLWAAYSRRQHALRAADVCHSCALACYYGAQTQCIGNGLPARVLASTVAMMRVHDLINAIRAATLFSFPSWQLRCIDHRTRNNDTCNESAERNSADAANLREVKANVKVDMALHTSL